MYSKETVGLRPNWEARVKKVGLTPDHWSEGSMVVVKESPADLVNALMDYAARVPAALNNLFEEDNVDKAPEFTKLSKEEVFSAVASSWAHQDVSLPLRFDIAVHKLGGYSLIAIKGDYLEGMITAASACKAWHHHHFDGMTEMVEVNYLQEALISSLFPFGKHSSPPSIKDVTILSSDSLKICADYLSQTINEQSGLSLSEIGVANIDKLRELDYSSQLTPAVIKVDAWKDILSCASSDERSQAWLDLFNRPRSFTMQPPWVLALDEMVDFAEEVEDDNISMVLNVWLDISSQSPVPLVVSSEYKPGYKFEESMITPVVMNFLSIQPQE